MKQWTCDFLAGSISGILGVFFGHPLDTVKCRLQANPKQYSNTIISLAKIIKEEKILGLFKGVLPPVINQFPINALLFSEYYRMNRILDKYSKYSKGWKYYLGGTWSGLIHVFINTPCELIKCKQQFNYKKFVSTKEVATGIIKTNGYLGLYKGFCASFNRDVFSFGFYFYAYYTLKDYLDNNKITNSFSLMMIGGITGVFTWLSTYPFDTLKTIIQTDEGMKTLTQNEAYKKLVKDTNSNVIGLYKGISPTLIRAFVVNSIIFYTNEVGQIFFYNFLKD